MYGYKKTWGLGSVVSDAARSTSGQDGEGRGTPRPDKKTGKDKGVNILRLVRKTGWVEGLETGFL